MGIKLIYMDKEYTFEESPNCYISPYSCFMVEQFSIMCINKKMTICDFGAGTGVLGLLASAWNPKSIVMIENNNLSYGILVNNCGNNIDVVPKGVELKCIRSVSECIDKFDRIICNPASLPNFIRSNSFCDGGELGLDMIIVACDFAFHKLKKGGSMYIIVTGILPYGIIERHLEELRLQYRVVGRKVIPFRDHYNGIKEWVDELKVNHNEMYYIQKNDIIYEELMLWEIRMTEE